MHPPVWWTFWYPARFRRPEDVWRRLPKCLQQHQWIKSVGALVFVGFCLALLSGAIGIPLQLTRPPWFRTLLFITLAANMVWLIAMLVVQVRVDRYLRQRGLSSAEIHRVLSPVSSTDRLFWSRPERAALLLPDESPSIEAARSPSQNLDQIVQLARKLNSSAGDAGQDATAAARELVSQLVALDSEVARLSREVDPQEVERIAKKMESIEAGAGNDPGQIQMRDLLSRQLALLRQFQERLDFANLRRRRSADLLSRLRAAVGKFADVQLDATRSGPAKAHLRELCQRITSEQKPAVTASDLPTAL